MEDHFDRLLNVEQAANSSSSVAPNAVKFIQSPKYMGFREGYVFKLGEKGIGYYWDRGDNRYAAPEAEQEGEEKGENTRTKKRKLETEGNFCIFIIRFDHPVTCI